MLAAVAMLVVGGAWRQSPIPVSAQRAPNSLEREEAAEPELAGHDDVAGLEPNRLGRLGEIDIPYLPQWAPVSSDQFTIPQVGREHRSAAR